MDVVVIMGGGVKPIPCNVGLGHIGGITLLVHFLTVSLSSLVAFV